MTTHVTGGPVDVVDQARPATPRGIHPCPVWCTYGGTSAHHVHTGDPHITGPHGPVVNLERSAVDTVPHVVFRTAPQSSGHALSLTDAYALGQALIGLALQGRPRVSPSRRRSRSNTARRAAAFRSGHAAAATNSPAVVVAPGLAELLADRSPHTRDYFALGYLARLVGLDIAPADTDTVVCQTRPTR